MTYKQMLQQAREQSAYDASCQESDFLQSDNQLILSQKNENAKKYYTLPFDCHLFSYGSSTIVSANSQSYQKILQTWKEENTQQAVDSLSTADLVVWLQKAGYTYQSGWICFLPSNTLHALECHYPTKILYPADFASLYTKDWQNALCEQRKELDTLGIGAYDGEKLIGFAACSADCAGMLQIGIDVLAEYRQQGIASALTSQLAVKILEQGQIPFYAATWSNLKSIKNAQKSGFLPAWSEVVMQSQTKKELEI